MWVRHGAKALPAQWRVFLSFTIPTHAGYHLWWATSGYPSNKSYYFEFPGLTASSKAPIVGDGITWAHIALVKQWSETDRPNGWAIYISGKLDTWTASASTMKHIDQVRTPFGFAFRDSFSLSFRLVSSSGNLTVQERPHIRGTGILSM